MRPVTTPHPDELWRLASAQWAEITANLPDLAPAVALQQHLIKLMVDAASALGDAGPGLLAQASIREKWRRGLPALRNEMVPIPPGLKDILPPLCTALADGGAGETALHIRDAIMAKEIDADSLLSVSLARNQKAIRTSALHMGFSPDLVWLIGELGSAPLAHHLSSIVDRPSIVHRPSSIVHRPSSIVDGRSSIDDGGSTIDDGRSTIDDGRSTIDDGRSTIDEGGSTIDDGRSTIDDLWDRGYCPFCGSWPTFVEALDGTLTLRCSYCALGWSLTSRRCVYCANSGNDFVAAAPDVSRPDQRVDLCGRCGGYTKVIDVRQPAPFPLLAIVDLATMKLDEGAMQRGYRRPELFDLDKIEPRTATC